LEDCVNHVLLEVTLKVLKEEQQNAHFVLLDTALTEPPNVVRALKERSHLILEVYVKIVQLEAFLEEQLPNVICVHLDKPQEQ